MLHLLLLASRVLTSNTGGQAPQPTPTVELAYGSQQSQRIDVFVPRGSGPHPVLVLLHGGCWSEKTAGREQLRAIGAEMAGRG